MKKILKGCITAFCAAIILTPLYITTVNAHENLHEERVTTRISNNTYLHEVSRITRAGILQFQVLEIPLNDPFLDIGVFNSQVEYGLRQPTTTLLNAGNAIAGVNGDFFGMTSRYSVALGVEAIDGHFSMHNSLNQSTRTSSTFFMGDNGAFINYINPQISLALDGQAPFYVGMVNMVSDLRFPSFLTYGYFESTAQLDTRLGRSYKIVVEDGIVTEITFHTVNVPQNGFVVIMDPATFWQNYHRFHYGQRAEMVINANVNLDAINTAISGSYRILYGGQVTPSASRSTARNPRTLLGLNHAADTLILMTIDGRGASIGVGLPEAAQLMREFGAYHAINLDGGGSTTMAARLPAQNLSIINTPSDGGQRAVINAIGVTSSAPQGAIHSMEFYGTQRYIPIGLTEPLAIRAFDAYMNPLLLHSDLVQITAINGHVTPCGLVAHSPGAVYVQAHFGDIVAQHRFFAIDVAQIIPSTQAISANTWINFRGLDNYGRSTHLNPEALVFQTNPSYLGEMDGNWFISNYSGNGWLTVAAHNARAFIPITLNPDAETFPEVPQSDVASDSRRVYTMHPRMYGEGEIWLHGQVEAYFSYLWYDVFIAQIVASGRGILAHNPYAWLHLVNDVSQTDSRYIVIHTNFSPLYFENATEFQMFHRLMRDLADTGRNVFVVSAQGEYNWTHNWDGVRYINLAHHYYDDYLYQSGIFTLRLMENDFLYNLEMISAW